jgi:hypothetical protein
MIESQFGSNNRYQCIKVFNNVLNLDTAGAGM